jgi:hypothetical protein
MKVLETMVSIPMILIYLCTVGMFSFHIKFPSWNTIELDGWMM